MVEESERNSTFEEQQVQQLSTLAQNTTIFAGLDAKTITNYILTELKNNDEAKGELYRTIKLEMGFDAEPFFENFLGKRKNKVITIKDMDQPYRSVVQLIIDEYDEGYHVEQIAKKYNWTKSAVHNAIKNREKYEKEEEDYQRRERIREAKEEAEEREALLALLPWWKRIVARLTGAGFK